MTSPTLVKPLVYNPASGGFQTIPAGSVLDPTTLAGLTVTEVSGNVSVSGGGRYAALSGNVAITASLPALSSLSSTANNAIDIFDGQNNASVNNITVKPAGSDQIAYYGSSGDSLVLAVNGAGVRVLAESGTWRAFPISGA